MMLHSHFLLLMLRAHLLVMHRLLIHRMLPASTAGHFAGVRFTLVSARVSLVPLISGLHVVSVCSGISCSLKITFSHVPGFISTFSCTPLLLLPLRPQVPARPCLVQRLRPC